MTRHCQNTKSPSANSNTRGAGSIFRFAATASVMAFVLAMTLPQTALGASQNTNYVYMIPVTGVDAAPPAPTVPVGVSASGNNAGGYNTVNWNPVQYADSWTVLRSTSGNPASAAIIADGITGTSYQDATAQPGLEYWYFVRATNETGMSNLSAGDSAMWIPTPAVPADVSASSNNADGYIEVDWSPSKYADSYTVWRAASNDPASATIIASDITGTYYRDDSANKGVMYWYFVQAANQAGPSSLSSGDSAKWASTAKKAWREYFAEVGISGPSQWSEGFTSTGNVPIPDKPYPASVVYGNIILGHNGLDDIKGLSSLTSLKDLGSLILEGNDLSDVDALSNLTSVGWTLGLFNNQLTNVDGLSSLTTVNRSLFLGANKLTDVDGLSNLTYVGLRLRLGGNPLTNVDGLSNLNYVGGYLDLRYSPQLTDLSGLSGITHLGGEIRLDENMTITDPISSDAWLCQPEQADKFVGSSQNEVCGL